MDDLIGGELWYGSFGFLMMVWYGFVVVVVVGEIGVGGWVFLFLKNEKKKMSVLRG